MPYIERNLKLGMTRPGSCLLNIGFIISRWLVAVHLLLLAHGLGTTYKVTGRDV